MNQEIYIVVNHNNTVEVTRHHEGSLLTLTPGEAINLSLELKKAAEQAIAIVTDIPVIPERLHLVINMVTHLEYVQQGNINQDTGLSLYQITATFKDGKKSKYYYECSFSDDAETLHKQLEYAGNVPMSFIDSGHELPVLIEKTGSHIGFNISKTSYINGSYQPPTLPKTTERIKEDIVDE